MDKLTGLKVFCRVVESGGFSAAGRRLGMSGTMVGNYVQALEQELGARLLNRTTRAVGLTETGSLYYERAVRILAEVEEADLAASTLSSSATGNLRVFTSSHILRVLLPVFSDYMNAFPDVSVELDTGERMVDLIEGRYDLCFWTNLPSDPNFIVRKLAPWRHMLVCSPAYREGHAPILSPADVTAHRCIRYAYYPWGDEWRFIDQQKRPVTVKVKAAMVTTSSDVLRALAVTGDGISLAPSFVVAEELANGTLLPLLPEFLTPELSVNAVYPNRSHLPSKTRALIDFAVERTRVLRDRPT